ncbi:hypothetical protein VTJ83DRAFT_2846 [Remersonia thermophila]|uniref:Cyanovirin-N domain-containing protein n=1 Tax=Remersonia thermophila TaxID=72144 RepID=A0ABR4DCH5_9PEZI
MLMHNKLDLNKCLGVDKNGDLIFMKNGYFEEDCKRCSVTFDGILHCECFRPDEGQSSIVGLNLNEGISNEHGMLKCNGGKAETWKEGPLRWD